MADSTKAMRKTVIDRDILLVFQNRRMAEIGPEDLRSRCAKIKGRGPPNRSLCVAVSPVGCAWLPKWEILRSMRVIAKSSLQKFWERPGCADARGPLHSWFVETVKATWRTPQDIKDQYASASICGNNRVVFNVGGNKYRLVVEIQYQASIVWVKFVGTHAQYDRIDVETVNEY